MSGLFQQVELISKLARFLQDDNQAIQLSGIQALFFFAQKKRLNI